MRQSSSLLACAALAAAAAAQDHRAALPPAPRRAPDVQADAHHNLGVRPLPSEVLTWVKAALERRAASAPEPADPHADGTTSVARGGRPAGAGRWVVAVVVDPEADVDPHAVLGLARSDVLVLAPPGLCVRPEELALLEHAQREERLALCLVMARAAAASPAQRGDTPAAQALRRRLAQAEGDAARSQEAATAVQARLQASAITSASDALREAAKVGVFRAAVALLPPRGDAVQIAAPWFDRPLPDEAFAEQAQRRRRDASPAAAPAPATASPGARPSAGPPVPYPAVPHPAAPHR